MHCPSCNHDNRAERRFCTECGATLSVACPSCGASVEAGEKFCGECGAALGGRRSRRAADGAEEGSAGASPSQRALRAPPAPSELAATIPSPAPASERRQLTVLFSDLVGSTPLSQQLDAEERRDVVSRYHHTTTEAVEKFGGHVAKNLGDGLLIYFGWPTAREDDPERAARAGLAIVGAVREPCWRGGTSP